MCDRLTQLQDAVNAQADNFCNSIGVLQQMAQPSSFPEFEKSTTKPPPQPQEDYAQLFASLIARTAKDIDALIDSLPSDESSPELQASHLRRLEIENSEAAQRLQEAIAQGEALLAQIQRALSEIANSQLRLREDEMNNGAPASSTTPSSSTLGSSNTLGASGGVGSTGN